VVQHINLIPSPALINSSLSAAPFITSMPSCATPPPNHSDRPTMFSLIPRRWRSYLQPDHTRHHSSYNNDDIPYPARRPRRINEAMMPTVSRNPLRERFRQEHQTQHAKDVVRWPMFKVTRETRNSRFVAISSTVHVPRTRLA
jgi:hypothetical protein